MSTCERVPTLEALRPAEFAAWREDIENLEARGWRFRPGTSRAVVVAERGLIKHFAPTVKRLVAEVSNANERN
jgi:hypothetical protein